MLSSVENAPTISADNEILIYVLTGIAVLSIVLQFFRKESSHFSTWISKMRRTTKNRKRSEMDIMRKDIDKLYGQHRVFQMRMRLHDRLVETHARWDHQMIMKHMQNHPEEDILPPPRLIPTEAELQELEDMYSDE